MPTTVAQLAARYAPTIMTALAREYPNNPAHQVTGPDDRPLNRDLHPAFYGCYDWHSAVHMTFTLVRLLRLAPGAFDAGAARALLDAHLAPAHLRVEAAYVAAHPTWERPYGWGWLLTLADELAAGADTDADLARWSTALRGLADAVVANYLAWLPRAGLPVRVGMHGNSAFGLERALAWSRRLAAAGDPVLLAAITAAAHRWYGGDADAPLAYEPCAADFLSPTLAEAVLMAEVGGPEVDGWLRRFLPGLAASAGPLASPAVVVDPADGQGAHLDGLNLSRAWHLRLLAPRLADDDARRIALAAAEVNEAASLAAVANGEWMSEHWLATYALLAVTAA